MSAAIRSVERVVSRNVSLPILNTILLRTESGKLKLTATNLEVGVHCWIGAKIEQEGVIAVPARILSDFVANIQDEKVTLSSEKEVLTITSEHATTQILGMKHDEFPIVPALRDAVELLIPGRMLGEGLQSVVDSASLLETRPELSGVYVQSEKRGIVFAATDSFRLSERIVNVSVKQEKNFIIPRATVLEIIRLVSERGEEVILAVSESQLAVRGNDIELISRLIDGKYPEYKKVIPEKFSTSITVDKNELERTIRMASIFSSSVADLTMKATDSMLRITAKNSDKGHIDVKLPASPTKTPFEITVNYRYLLDGLKAIPAKSIVIGYTGPGSPLALHGEGVEGVVYVIMPLRTS